MYQPATVYFHTDTYPSHDEEGCAVFSKHPIVHSDYLVCARTCEFVFVCVHLCTCLCARVCIHFPRLQRLLRVLNHFAAPQLMSKDYSDREDEHQRVCLHAVITVQPACTLPLRACVSFVFLLHLCLLGHYTQLPNGTVVDVYTTHLSLSMKARNRTVREVWKFIQSSRRGHIQAC